MGFIHLFIQTFHHNGNLITEQGTGEQNPIISVGHRRHAYVRNYMKTKTPPTTHTNQFQLFHDSSRQQYGTYIIHYSIELIAFSAECTSLIVQLVGAPSNQQALTLRRIMSYIYGAPILDVSRSHTTTQHSR